MRWPLVATELRKSGMSIIGDVPWGTHFCHFYETKQDLLDTLIPYFKAGLESKEFCLWVVSNSELITVEEAKAALEQAVPDLDRHLSDGNIEILNGHDWYFEKNVLNFERVVSAWDAKVKRALARGYDGLRASADTFWLAEKDWKDFFAYEKQVNDWITDQTMTVLCTYPLAKSGAAEVLDVVESHQFAITRRQGEWKVIESPELIQAKAEIKRLNEALQRVIDRTPKPPVILSYVAAVLSVIAALIIALLLDIHMAAAPASLFLCAVMFSAWFGGVGPGLLTMVLSFLAFIYFFLTPSYSLTVEINQMPRFLIFVLASAFVVALSAAQRSAAESLRRARDVLDGTVQELKRTNVALRAENAERKQAEEKLKQSGSQLAEAQHLAHVGSWNWDLQRKALIWSDELYRIFGVDPQTFNPAYEAVIMESIHAEDRALVRGTVESSLKAQEPFSFYYRILRPDGEERVIHSRGDIVNNAHGNPIRMFGTAQDVTERKQAEERLRATTEQLRALSARIHSAKEEEGTRIGREIHDELGAALTSLKWDLESFDKVISESGDQSQLQRLRERIEAMLRLTETTIGTIRRISSELRPSVLDDLGLVEAIEWQAQQFQARTGIICQCDCSLENLDLSREQSTAVFRIFQEALTNILRHAQATSVDITMKAEAGEFVLAIIDNGRGITENEKSGAQSLGLLGLQERAHLIGGKININGVEGKGTMITVQVPISG
jgi:PAS domain S-box-containing protein